MVDDMALGLITCYKVRAKRSEGSGETERGDEETGGSREEDTCSQAGRFESD